MKKEKIKFSVLFVSSLVLLICVFLLGIFIASLPVTSSQNSYTKRIEVPSGSSVKSVAKNLNNEGLIRSSSLFYLASRFPFVKGVLTGNSKPFALKSGVYSISSDMKLASVFEILSSGQQEYIRLSIPEGYSLSKIAEKLSSFGVCSKEDFINAAKNTELLLKYKIPSDSFEGFLFPDTYFFTPKMQGSQVVVQMADNFFEKLSQVQGVKEKSPSEIFSTVTLASIIEREYRRSEEAPLIASVFVNRLNKNIGLYSCATIEYIITEIQGKPHPEVITYADLAIDNPYNTYKWAGLTPGPISNPGLTALNAAFNPAKTNYYFFRLVDAQSGKHVFSTDFSTHISEGYISSTKRAGK